MYLQIKSSGEVLGMDVNLHIEQITVEGLAMSGSEEQIRLAVVEQLSEHLQSASLKNLQGGVMSSAEPCTMNVSRSLAPNKMGTQLGMKLSNAIDRHIGGQ